MSCDPSGLTELIILMYLSRTPPDSIATSLHVPESLVNHVIEFGTPRPPLPTRTSDK
jgi:hypothetical protein